MGNASLDQLPKFQPAARDELLSGTYSLFDQLKFQLLPAPGVVVIGSAMLQALSVHLRQKLQQRLKARNLLKGDP